MCWPQGIEGGKLLYPSRCAWPGWEGGAVVVATIVMEEKTAFHARLEQRIPGSVATLHAWFSGTSLLSACPVLLSRGLSHLSLSGG